MLKLYYKSVNRGLAFTKPGLYTIGFVMLIGLLAIVTGINGFYLFMSTGLALLVVSGVISERVMHSNQVTHLEPVSADAKTPFDLNFSVKNSSSTFTTYGIETSFTLDKPDVHFITKPANAPISGRALKIGPQMTTTFYAHCVGLPRGDHKFIHVAQRTNYPFGFLEKFKIIALPCSLTITPAIDSKFFSELEAEIRKRRLSADADREFFSHIPYTYKEPLKHIDWKRSAGKPPKDWVVKQFRSQAQNNFYKIVADWQSVTEAPSEAAYEAYLSRLRTAVKVLALDSSVIGLEVSANYSVWGKTAVESFLAGIPSYQDRAKSLATMDTREPNGKNLVYLHVSPTGYSWLANSTRGKTA